MPLGYKSNKQEVGGPGKHCYLHYIWIQSSTQHCWYQLGVLSVWVCLWEKYRVNLINNVAISVCALEFTIIFLLTSILKASKKWTTFTQDPFQEAHNYFQDLCKAVIKTVFLRISGEKDSGLWDVHNFQKVLNALRVTSGSSWIVLPIVKYKTILGLKKAGLIKKTLLESLLYLWWTHQK